MHTLELTDDELRLLRAVKQLVAKLPIGAADQVEP